MAKQQTNAYDTDKEKRDLAIARAEEARSRTTQRQGDPYTQARGFPNLATMTEAESSAEKRATNQRLTENAAQNSKIEALKAMSLAGAGGPHATAALDELAKIAGVKVPKTVDPKQAKLNELRKAKGLPPLGGAEEQPTSGAQQNQSEAPQQDQSLFQPQNYGSGLVEQPQPTAPREASLGNPITSHVGTGGIALIQTPQNPTGEPAFAFGGLLDNPTHAAALNQQRQQAEMYPTGPVSPSRPITYFPGEAMDRLAGGSQPKPPANQLPPKPAPVPAGGATLVSNPAAAVPPPAPFQFDASKLVTPPAGPTSNFSVQGGGFAPGMNPIEALHGAIKQSVQAELTADQERRKRMTTPGVSVF